MEALNLVKHTHFASMTLKPATAGRQTYEETHKTKDCFTRYGFKKILPKEQEKEVQVLAVTQKASAACTESKEKKRYL